MASFRDTTQKHAELAAHLHQLTVAIKDGPADMVLYSESLGIRVPAPNINLDDFRDALARQITTTIAEMRETWQLIEAAAAASGGDATPPPTESKPPETGVSPDQAAPSPGVSRVIRS